MDREEEGGMMMMMRRRRVCASACARVWRSTLVHGGRGQPPRVREWVEMVCLQEVLQKPCVQCTRNRPASRHCPQLGPWLQAARWRAAHGTQQATDTAEQRRVARR